MVNDMGLGLAPVARGRYYSRHPEGCARNRKSLVNMVVCFDWSEDLVLSCLVLLLANTPMESNGQGWV